MELAWEFWIDRGGTFTDIVAKSPDGRLLTRKLLSENPGLYQDAAVQGIFDILGTDTPSPGTIKAVKMGTTVATNALLERKGVPVLLVITKGFRDLLQIGYQARPRLFDLNIQRPEVLYSQVSEADERLDAAGAVLQPLDGQALRTTLQRAFDDGIRAVAVAFLHGHLNPVHELQAEEIAVEIGFTQISLSHQVSRLAKLVSRGDTTVVDSYLSPILRHYVNQTAGALDVGRVCQSLLFMQSNGGLTDARLFQGKDAVLSGPAGGIIGMAKTAEAAGFTHVIGFDMGGTSTDVSHYAGRFDRSFETEVAGVRMRAPMMDIHTVAAGGGSICSFRDGRFQVGPESAGADPGPACYRRGGPLTITDCNVILGKLSAEHFPAVFGPKGNEKLDALAARQEFARLARFVADETGLPEQSPEALATGFLKIAVDKMANAIKKISIQRGHDVGQYTLQCFGGAGGQHACLVADCLGMPKVLVHPFAGVLSAFGMGLAEVRVLREVQFDAPLTDLPKAQSRLAALQDDAARALMDQDVQVAEMRGTAHLRYAGSHQTIEVAFADLATMHMGFNAAHQARFGFLSPETDLWFEMISCEAISAVGAVPPIPLPVQRPQPKGTTAIFGLGHVPLWDRADLPAGWAADGPIVIIEPTGTNIVEPGWRASIDPLGNLILDRMGATKMENVAESHADPVLLEVMSNLFMSIADQMGATLALTAHSVNIKERFDFSCAIFDRSGDLVANAPHVPVHLGSMSAAVKSVMAANPSAADGDAFMLNDPSKGGTHLPDVTVVTPVFIGGEPVFWLGARGHHADIGGRTPGSAPPDSRHIREEGVVIRNFQLVEAGRFRDIDARALLLDAPYPCRNVDQNIADLKAQVASNETGKRELVRICRQYGAQTVIAYMRFLQENAEESVRKVVDRLTDGQMAYPMDGGQVIAVSLRVNRADRSVVIDFTGTSPQDPQNYNAPLAVCRAVVLYVFRCLVGAEIPLNEGCLKPLHLIVPEGSMLNPGPDAAVIAGNTEVSQAACNALFGALGAVAAGQGTMNNFVWGNDRFQNYETIAGGTGAGPGFSGCDAVQSHMTNTRMTDPEILEKRFPVRLESFEICQGSGGTGQWRGGHGARRKIRFLEEVTVTTLSSHRKIPPFGLAGGGAGKVGRNWVVMPDGAEIPLAGNAEISLPPGSVFVMETPGGGGFGAANDQKTGAQDQQAF